MNKMKFERHLGRCRISFRMLEESLGFPPGYIIIDSETDMQDRTDDTLSLLIEGPDLPETQEGSRVAEVEIKITRMQAKFVNRILSNWQLKQAESAGSRKYD